MRIVSIAHKQDCKSYFRKASSVDNRILKNSIHSERTRREKKKNKQTNNAN